MYIGFTDDLFEGSFGWHSRFPVSFLATNNPWPTPMNRPWGNFQPDNFGGNENYVTLGEDLPGDPSKWNDVPGTTARRYILELEGTFKQTIGFPSGSTFPVGTTTNTFVATDVNGVTSTCSFDVTVIESIAITEWLSEPSGNLDSTLEWVELFNYGTVPVDIQNWRIQDQGTASSRDDDVITTVSTIIQPGDYAIIAKNKNAFESNWLGGCSSSKIIEVPELTLANRADEILIVDNNGNLVWQVAHIDDNTEGNATWYTESNFNNRIWGDITNTGVDRSGIDPSNGVLGYEKNNITPDSFAYTAINGDLGSPLQGTGEDTTAPDPTGGSTAKCDQAM